MNLRRRLKLAFLALVVPEKMIADPKLVLHSKDGKFMCEPEAAVEAAYALSCLEALGFYDRWTIDPGELGELLWGYIDGDKSLEETREAAIEWKRELDEEAEDKRLSKVARDAGHDRYELEQVEGDPDFWHLWDWGKDEILKSGSYVDMSEMKADLDNGLS